jgi:hypothetical protein
MEGKKAKKKKKHKKKTKGGQFAHNLSQSQDPVQIITEL